MFGSGLRRRRKEEIECLAEECLGCGLGRESEFSREVDELSKGVYARA